MSTNLVPVMLRPAGVDEQARGAERSFCGAEQRFDRPLVAHIGLDGDRAAGVADPCADGVGGRLVAVVSQRDPSTRLAQGNGASGTNAGLAAGDDGDLVVEHGSVLEDGCCGERSYDRI
jgi:hypothetical protein